MSDLVVPKFLNPLSEEHKNYFPLSIEELQNLKMGGGWSRVSQQRQASARPLVSIITVVRNNPSALERTIQSVLSQSYKDREQLIIDGASTKETLRVIDKYEQKVDFWLSHADQGIYDAMNRGTLLARGVWLLFLNAGDTFYTSESLLKLLSYCDNSAELIYGDHEVRYTNKNYSRIHFSSPIRSYYNLSHHMGFCHQSLIVRKDIQSKNLFDNNNLSADYKFVLGSFLSGYKIQHVPLVVASVDTAGLSQKRRIYMEIERWRVSWELSPRSCLTWLPLTFFLIVCSTSMRFLTQKLLGDRLTAILLRLKYTWLDRSKRTRKTKGNRE